MTNFNQYNHTSFLYKHLIKTAIDYYITSPLKHENKAFQKSWNAMLHLYDNTISTYPDLKE